MRQALYKPDFLWEERMEGPAISGSNPFWALPFVGISRRMALFLRKADCGEDGLCVRSYVSCDLIDAHWSEEIRYSSADENERKNITR